MLICLVLSARCYPACFLGLAASPSPPSTPVHPLLHQPGARAGVTWSTAVPPWHRGAARQQLGQGQHKLFPPGTAAVVHLFPHKGSIITRAVYGWGPDPCAPFQPASGSPSRGWPRRSLGDKAVYFFPASNPLPPGIQCTGQSHVPMHKDLEPEPHLPGSEAGHSSVVLLGAGLGRQARGRWALCFPGPGPQLSIVQEGTPKQET